MKYINTILLGFIVLWLNNAASTADKVAVRDGINILFNEPDQSNYVDYSGLPQYRLKSNTNIVGRLLPIDEDQLVNLKVDLSNVTVTKLNQWKASHMSNTNHLRWARGDDWDQVVKDAGLEPVPTSKETP